MKKIFLLLLATTTLINAQITPKVFQSFPAHIVYRIDELNSIIKLTEEQQLKLGEKLAKKDSTANAFIRNGNLKIDLKEYFTVSKPLLAPILSPEELDVFMYQNDINNRFLLALKLASELKLTPEQKALIRQQNDLINLKPSSYNKVKFYKTKLDSILTKPQYGKLVASIYEQQSQIEAKKQLKEIKAIKIVADKDTSAVYQQLYGFHIMRNSITDIESEKLNSNMLIDLNNKINLEKQPAILIRYNMLTNGFYRNNLFAETIKYEKELTLTAAQIDSTLTNYRVLEIMKMKNEKSGKTLYSWKELNEIENNGISKILDSKQLTLLLVNKNKKVAMQTAVKNWETLDKQGLTKDLDKNNTLKEFATYQLNYLVATDRIKMNNNQVNLFYKRDVELKKPELLKQLDQIKQTDQNAKSTKNELRW